MEECFHSYKTLLSVLEEGFPQHLTEDKVHRKNPTERNATYA